MKVLMNKRLNERIKGTVHAISSDPLLIELHVRFTTVPLKMLSDQV